MAFFAGLVDAVAGGGGLIQVPALFAAYPDAPPATLLSTNKVSAVGGTLNAARKYLRHVSLPWAVVGPAIVAGFVGSLLGANAVSNFPAEPLRKALPFVLLFLLLYTWFQPSLGEAHAPKIIGRFQQLKAAILGLTIPKSFFNDCSNFSILDRIPSLLKAELTSLIGICVVTKATFKLGDTKIINASFTPDMSAKYSV